MGFKLTKSQIVAAAWLLLVLNARAENVNSEFSGPSSNRVDVVFVGDGYQESELDLYKSHVDNAIDYMFRGTEEPFNRYENFFNFHQIEVISEDSGTDFAPPSSRGTISGVLDHANNLAPNVLEFYTDSVLPAGTTFLLDQYTEGSVTPVRNVITLPDGLQAGSFAYIFSDTTTAPEFDAWFGANSTGNSTVFSGTYGAGGQNSTYVLNEVNGVPIDSFGTPTLSNGEDDWAYRDSLTRPSAIFNATAFSYSDDGAFDSVVSNEEAGADAFPIGTYVAPDSVFADTALDSRYFFDGSTERLLSVNTNKALEVESRSLEFPGEMRFAVVNSEDFGGAGGTFATFAGGHAAAAEIALHEIGHSFSGLADEYESFVGEFPNGEPSEPNVTIDPTGAKWEQWLGYEQEGIGVIGAYEGGRYYTDGIYRPSVNSKMRSLFQPFDAVSREQLVLEIYKYVDPIDTHTSDSIELSYQDSASVEVVDPEIIDVSWLVNDQQIDFDGLSIPISEFVAQRIQPGVHELTVIAADNTDWIRLEEERPIQEVTWTVRYFPGDFNGNELADTEDIDGLTAAIMDGSNPSIYDLNLDSLVDAEDHALWITANQILPGDTDLNGRVEFADFLVLSNEFGTDATSWSSGNFDGIDGVAFADFLALSSNFGLSAAAQSVPEPASHLAMLFVLGTFLRLRNRRR